MPLEDLLEMGGKMVVQYLFSQLTASTERPRERHGLFEDAPQENPPAPVQSAGCPVCELHKQAAEARGLLEGLSLETRGGESIPPGLGGTIRIARDCYAKAQDQLKSVAISAPSLRENCVSLNRQAAEMESLLAGQVGSEEIDLLAISARRFWADTYKLAYAFYSQPAGGARIREE